MYTKMYKIFIDGKEGTTGLKIFGRLAGRDDISIIALPEELRKDVNARREALNSCDIAFLCLPDTAARESVSMIENPDVRVIDTSTAHRTNNLWTYGFPELSQTRWDELRTSKRVAVPGCHASGFVALVYPLIERGLIPPETPLNSFSITGYSGGGRKMIAIYEADGRDKLLDAPRLYALGQAHKHLPEMTHVCGLKYEPGFYPVVSDYYSGMLVTVPLPGRLTAEGVGIENIKDVYRNLFRGPVVCWREDMDEEGLVSASALSGIDRMDISVSGNAERMTLMARFDNLGKGASGAAIECMNIMLGADPYTGLVL